MQLKLRPFLSDDVDDLVEHANNYNVAKNLTNKFPYPYLRKDGEIFIEWALSHDPTLIKAIEINGKVAGSIGIHPLTDIYGKSAELGYWIGEEFWGKGLVAKAVEEMLVYAFETFNINRVFARTSHVNLASQRVLLKSGFVQEAAFKETIFKYGEYYDELVFAFRKQKSSE